MSEKHWLDGAPRTRAKIQGRIFYANVGDLEREMLEFTADLERETVAITAELARVTAERDVALLDVEQRRRLIVGIRQLIADDSHALTFQTMGSYRGNLLKTLDAAREG